MGSWFSNFHIRKNEKITVNSIADYICRFMEAQQYLSTTTEDDADIAFAVLSDEKSKWYSVYSDLFLFQDPKQFVDYANPMSEEFETDILGISCFDSDYVYLNLIDVTNKIDAWVGVGRAFGLGIRRRTNVAAWKNKVVDYNNFKECIKKKYDFAEDILREIEDDLMLPQYYSSASYEYLEDFGLNKSAMYLYFKLPESMKTQELPKFVQNTVSRMPSFINRYNMISGYNIGGASKGISVYFLGPYVENEEITFSDVCFVYYKNGHMKNKPFELKKVMLSDGQYAYYHHDPGFKIPEKVDERLPLMKQILKQDENEIVVRYMPHGNPRKILDITVVLVPDKNRDGQISWNVWREYGSKKAFIQHHNNKWSGITGQENILLREEDFD